MKDHDRAKLEAELEELRAFKENFRKQEEERIITEEQLEFSWTGNLGRWSWHFPSGRVVFNPRKVEVLGYDYESFVPVVDSFTALIHPDDYQNTMQIMRDHLTGLSPVYEAEYRMRCKDGSWRWFYDRGKVVERDNAKSPVRITGIVFDISAEKERQRELEEANLKLKEANSVKNRFFSIIAHDLRSPISSLISFIRLMQDERFRPEEKSFREMLGQLEDMVKNTDTLLENLLNWARSQTESIHPKPKPLGLMETVKNAIVIQENLALEKGITISCTIAGTTVVTADKEMLETVIRNLVSNAVKFSPRGGTVTISEKQSDDRIEVRVSDSGSGVDENQINQLFEIGSIFSTPGTANETGHGLGLQICNEFVRKNGGDLKVLSSPGKGSTFYFTLPASSSIPEQETAL
jgi:PAS domain S-box-containing protein